jgi:hypothetical protein
MDVTAIFLTMVTIIGLLMVFSLRGKARKSTTTSKRGAGPSLDRRQFVLQWQRIEQLFEQAGTEHTRSAVFEADKLVDQALRQGGYRGETFAERLRSAERSFSHQAVYQGLWDAHKIRNAMAHELGFDLPKHAAGDCLEKFRRGLQELKVLS